MLKIPILIDSDSIELMFIICTIMVYYEKSLTKIKKNMRSGTRTSSHMLYRLMATYTFIFYTLLLMNSGLCRLVKINFVFLKDTAVISNKSRFNQCTDCWIVSVPKMQMDRQKDRQTAFQLYIADYNDEDSLPTCRKSLNTKLSIANHCYHF